MAKHRKRRTRYNSNYVGRHRVVTPKSYVGQRMAVILPLTLSMALYPTIAGDGTGILPSVGNIIGIGILDETEAEAGEVIPDPTEVVDPPVVDLDSPAG